MSKFSQDNLPRKVREMLELEPMRCPTPIFLDVERPNNSEKPEGALYKLSKLASQDGLMDNEAKEI